MTVTKERIIDAVFETAELSRKAACEAVETLMKILKETLAGEENVMVSGFGKFQVKRKNARRGRNPQTGEALGLRPRRVVVFRNSGMLRRKFKGEESQSAADENFNSENKVRTRNALKANKNQP
jgi:integration host factor subunit alpha